jgi:beta-mannosidase
MDFRRHRNSTSLDGAWRLAWADSPHDEIIDAFTLENSGLPMLAATVPGSVETDLVEAGRLADPYVGMGAVATRDLEQRSWWYHRFFAATDVDNDNTEPFLIFHGLDCYADIFLNGDKVASTDNMLMEHRIPVSGHLWAENDLLVRIRPTLSEARKYDYPPNLFAGPGRYESVHVRKAAHMFGWDIFPRIVSAGIWRPVELVFLPRTRLENVWLETQSLSTDLKSARLVLHWHGVGSGFDAAKSAEIVVRGVCGDSCFEHRQPALFASGRCSFTVSDPCLWWPRGRGEACLYDTTVEMWLDAKLVDTVQFTHGIRTVALERTSTTDEAGSGHFHFRVNGERIYVLGSNWVPTDAIPGRQAERIPAAVELAAEVGCNLLRVWGGGVYEPDLFYDLCDRAGILVWQDFAMACAVYPQDDEFRGRIRAEATQVVRRLRQHACIALWSGDNECDQAWSWGGVPQDPNQNALTRVDIPAVLLREDPMRPYLPSSPCIDAEAFAKGEKYVSESHLWGPRNYYKSPYYLEALAHFVSEIGYHGCPDVVSLRKFLSPDKVWPYADNAEWTLHSTSPIPGVDLYDYRVELMAKQIRCLFGDVPDNVDDYVVASQIVQAEAMKFFVERFRMQKGRRSGMVWWNLLDGWPQMSDAVVDYYFARKLAFQTIRRSQQPLCLMLSEPENGRQSVVAVSELRTDVALEWTVSDALSGDVVGSGAGIAAADVATTVGELAADDATRRVLRIDWKSGSGATGINHYLIGNPTFALEAVWEGLRAVGLG